MIVTQRRRFEVHLLGRPPINLPASTRAHDEAGAATKTPQTRACCVRVKRPRLGKDLMPHRILLVEDAAELRVIAGRTLRSAGFEVAEVSDGTAALEFLSQHKPDLIILDIMMPAMNGYEVLHAVQRHAGLSDLPIIITTGMMIGPRDFNGSPLITVMPKPYGALALLNAVRTALAKRGFDRSRTDP